MSDQKKAPANRQNRVLVVEDNDFVRAQIVSYLAEMDCDVLEAREGGAALDAMAQHSFDIALVDVQMEPMGGLEFIRVIRDEGFDTPVVLVTGDQTTDLLEQAGKWSVSAVLMKPVQKARLQKTVQRTVQAHKKTA